MAEADDQALVKPHLQAAQEKHEQEQERQRKLNRTSSPGDFDHSFTHQRPEPVRVCAVGEHANALRRNPCGERLPVQVAKLPAPHPIRVDREIARIANARNLQQAVRAWFVAHDADTQGRGWITRAALWHALRIHRAAGIANDRRILRQGEGLFWTVVRDRVYLRGRVKVAEALSEWARDHAPDLIETNNPGESRDVKVYAFGDSRRWELTILHAWMYSRGMHNWRKAENTRARKARKNGDDYEPRQPRPFIQITTRKLSKLFGRSHRTMKLWIAELRESHELRSKQNFGQKPLDSQFVAPDGAKEYIAKTEQGEVIRHRWRIASTYYPSQFGIQEHNHAGQAHKARAASLAVVQPDDSNANRAARYRRYFYDAEHLDRVTKKHGGAVGFDLMDTRYLYIGTNRWGHGIFEPLNASADRQTRPHERAHFQRERELADVLA